MHKLSLKAVELFDVSNNISDFNGGKHPTRDIKFRTSHNKGPWTELPK